MRAFVDRVVAELDRGRPARDLDLTDEEAKAQRPLLAEYVPAEYVIKTYLTTLHERTA